MKKKIWFYPLIIIGVLLMLISSCKKDDKKDDTVPTTISDENFYRQLGSTLINCYTDIYNQNLAGKPIGTQNITADGPMGGTVIITGSNSYDTNNGIATENLVFSMTNVEYTNSSTYITQVKLTGATTFTGSFSDSYTSLNHQSDSLYIKGSVTYNGIDRNIDMTGVVNINRSTTTSVTIFGHSVSW